MEDTEEIENLVPTASMNDRAPGARAAAREKLGTVPNQMATCGEHAVCNALGAGDNAADTVVNGWRGVGSEQTQLDAHKVKAMHNHIGWFKAPANALTYKVCASMYRLSPMAPAPAPLPTLPTTPSPHQVAKYAALFSDKGYAVGQKFRAWLEFRRAARAAGDADAPELTGDEAAAEGLAESAELLGDCKDFCLATARTYWPSRAAAIMCSTSMPL